MELCSGPIGFVWDPSRTRYFLGIAQKLTSTLPEEYMTVATDQTRKSLGCNLYHAWFPAGERTSLPYWSESNAITFLGAESDTQETFFAEIADRFTSTVTVHFLQALQEKFGKKFHVVLDNAAYFASNQVAEFVEEMSLKVTYLPIGSPDTNPVEECWRQLKRSFGNRFIKWLDYLRSDWFAALANISPLRVVEYFCPTV